MISEELSEVHITSLEGLGSSYRMHGFFTLSSVEGEPIRIDFNGVAFGGNYGGHNVSIEINENSKEVLMMSRHKTPEEIEELIIEVQRRMLNNEMIIEYENIRPEDHEDGLGSL
jgi:hypothetical protein